MLTQLKLALRILKRRRFFTFISLFGVSFTIMALVVIAAMADAAVGANAPLGNRDRLVFATLALTQVMVPDTSYLVDSAEVDGRMVYDTTEQIGEQQRGSSTGGVSHWLYDKYMRGLAGVATSSHAAPGVTFDAYLDGRKVTFAGTATDADFWRIFDYEFLAGGPFNAEQVAGGAQVTVLSAAAAREYFGVADASVVGRTLPLGDDDFRVVGVVATPMTNFFGLEADVFLPNTSLGVDLAEPSIRGSGGVIFLAEAASEREGIKAELRRVSAAIEPLPDEDDNRFSVEGLTFLEETAHGYAYASEDRERSFRLLAPLVGILLALLLALPALNLVNVNLSRVYERAPEIAVRKSFGATDADIARQFVVETLVVTVIGALLGVALAVGAIALVNAEGYLGDIRLGFTPTVALVSAGLVLLLTLLTGVFPALRFARTPIATSLR